jgi:putative sigma-54 modulation protein
MQIEVKGRNLQVTDELREMVARRFDRVGRQVSEMARLEVELSEDRPASGPANQVADVTLHLKGVTLRASDSSRDIRHAVNLAADELARQVKRHRDKRRNRREQRAFAPPPGEADAGTLPAT